MMRDIFRMIALILLAALLLFIDCTFSQGVQCYDAFSCSGQENSGDWWYYLDGYKSAYNSTTTTQHARCTGSWSCADAVVNIQGEWYGTESDFNCYGGFSCSSMTYAVSSANVAEISCEGFASCSGASITGNSTSDPLQINVGAFGAVNATLTNFGTLQMQAEYASYGAVFVCQSGHSCSVTCNGTACAGAQYDCQSGSTCNIYCDSDAVCPEELDASYSLPAFANSVVENAYDMITNFYLTAEDDLCMNTSNNTLRDSATSFSSNTNLTSDGNICCRGKESCQHESSSDTNDVNLEGQNIVCSGSAACVSTTLTASGDLFCSGSTSCQESTATVQKNVHCTAMSSCSSLGIYGTDSEDSDQRNVYCTGASSCAQAGIWGMHNVYMLGTEAGSATIYSSGVNVNVYVARAAINEHSTMEIRCSDGDSCYLECLDKTACLNVEFDCSESSESTVCTTNCDTSAGYDCPMIEGVSVVGAATTSTPAPTSSSETATTESAQEQEDGSCALSTLAQLVVAEMVFIAVVM